MSGFAGRLRTLLARRLFAAAQRLDRRNPRWLAGWSAERKRRLFRRLWRPLASGLPDVHRVGDVELRVPPSMHALYVIEEYEPATARLIGEVLHSGQTAVDVGANLGYLSALMARAVGPGGRVWAVEPDPDNLRLLAENLDRNGLSERVTVVPAAAGRRNERLLLHRARVGARNTLHGGDGGAAAAGAVEVDVVPLDDVVPGRVDLVKIDVEGAEMEVLDGMRRLLAREPRPVLVVEWCPEAAMRAGHGPEDLPRRLAALGYELRLIPVCDGPGDLESALARVAGGELRDGWYGNLFAQPAAPAGGGSAEPGDVAREP